MQQQNIIEAENKTKLLHTRVLLVQTFFSIQLSIIKLFHQFQRLHLTQYIHG